MALAGHDTPIAVFNSTSNTTSYSGSLTVADGELIVVEFTGCGDTGTNNTTAWTVTLNGSAMTRQSGTTAGVNVVGVAGIFTAIASGSGSQTVALTTATGCRGMAANARRITGFDATTPIANAGQGDNFSSDTTSLTVPNGITTGADGNAVIGCIGINGGDVTGLAVSGADGSATGQTGSNAFSDAEWGNAYKVTATAGSVSFAWTWTAANRPAAAWVEINVATSGGTSVAFDALSYTETVQTLTANVNTPVPFDALAYTETVNALTATVNTPVALEALSYTETLNNVVIATTVDTPVDLDALAYSVTLNDIGAAVDTPVGLDALNYTESLYDLGTAVNTPVSLDALSYAETINTVNIGTSVSVALDALDYTLTLPDMGVSTGTSRQRGDDAFRSAGERDRFWRRKAEEWLEDYIAKLPEVAKKPARTRRRAAKRLLEEAGAIAAEIPPLAPRIDYLAALVRQLSEPRPDYTALATAIAAQMEQVEAEKRARRRRRDLEAVLLLAA